MTNKRTSQELSVMIKKLLQYFHEGKTRELHELCRIDTVWWYNHRLIKVQQFTSTIPKESDIHLEKMHLHQITEDTMVINGSYRIYGKDSAEQENPPRFDITIIMNGGKVVQVEVHDRREIFQEYGICTQEKQCYVEESEVVYVEADRNYVVWHCRNENLRERITLKELENKLSTSFVRVNRSFIVNRAYVRKIQRCELEMKNGDRIAIPVKNYINVRDELKKVQEPVKE